MAAFVIAVAVPLPPNVPFGGDVFPHLAAAVQTLAASGMQQWVNYAKGGPLPDGSRIGSRTAAYANGIELEQTGPFAWRIFNNIPYAEAIEFGTPPRDLKKMLHTSMKVRTRADGRRYLIIPFRWGTPGTQTFGRNVMPPAVHRFWQGADILRSEHRTPTRPARVSQTGAYDVKTRQPYLVPNYAYRWGTRLAQRDLARMGIRAEFHGKQYRQHPMAGMVNLRNPQGRGSKDSSYLTFRTMQEGSPGWLSPAIPGKHPARTVADQLEPIAERAFRAAAEADIRAYLGIK